MHSISLITKGNVNTHTTHQPRSFAKRAKRNLAALVLQNQFRKMLARRKFFSIVEKSLHGPRADAIGTVLRKKLALEKDKIQAEKQRREDKVASNWLMNFCFDCIQKNNTVRVCVGILILLNVISVLLESEPLLSSVVVAQRVFDGSYLNLCSLPLLLKNDFVLLIQHSARL